MSTIKIAYSTLKHLLVISHQSIHTFRQRRLLFVETLETLAELSFLCSSDFIITEEECAYILSVLAAVHIIMSEPTDEFT
jgi:hypothetical protein